MSAKVCQVYSIFILTYFDGNSVIICSDSVLFNFMTKISHTVDGFIFVGTNFRGLNENDTLAGFKIRGHSIFLHNSYTK